MIDPKDEDPDADFCLTVTSYVEVWLCIAHLGKLEVPLSCEVSSVCFLTDLVQVTRS